MSDTDSGASGGDPAAGTPTPGSTDQVPAGFVPQAELDRLEQGRRTLQSERDRLAAELERAKGASAAQPSGGSFADPAAFAREVLGHVNRDLSLREARSALSQEFPAARQEVLKADYGSPEEMRVAVERSHQAEESYRNQVRSEAEKDVLSRLGEKYGREFSIDTPQTPPSDGEGGEKQPTAADLRAMPFSEFRQLDPALVQKVLAQGA